MIVEAFDGESGPRISIEASRETGRGYREPSGPWLAMQILGNQSAKAAGLVFEWRREKL
jgi:hypothetical protein